MTGPLLADSRLLLDGRLRASLDKFTDLMAPHFTAIEHRFQTHLAHQGLDPRERKALHAVTPGAAALLLTSGQPIEDFFEQVLYHGRRLAKLKLSVERTASLLAFYRDLVESTMEVSASAGVLEAYDRLQTGILILLNQAFYEVREAETEVFYDLFWGELESRGLEELLQTFLGRLSRFCRAEASILCFADPASGDWLPRAAAGQTQRASCQSVEARTPRMERLSAVRFLQAQSEYEDLLIPEWAGTFASYWSLPLAAYGKTLGVVQFAFRSGYEWLPREMDLLAAAAERLILAAEKARLVEDLARRESQVRELAAYLSQVEEQERRRISRELHDEAGQSLLCLRLQLELLEKTAPADCGDLRLRLTEARELSEKTIQEIRRLIAALSPNVLEQYGLGAAVRQAVNRIRHHFPGSVSLEIGPLDPLPDRLGILVYRILQECLTNVTKHSKASTVNISL